MTYPVPYLVTYSYTGFAQALGDGSFPGVQLDQDFADMGASLAATIAFLDGITRSDGALKNGIVTTDALDTVLAAAFGDLATLAEVQALIATANADVVLTNADVALTHADVTTTAASAASAAASVAKLSATSTSSLAVGTGAKTFVTQSGKLFTAGQFLQIASNASALNFMHGTVTSYTGTSLVMNITDVGGAGTFADWNISIAGTQGPIGVPGALATSAAGGTADAITAVYVPANGSLTDKLVVAFVASAANATTTPTFAPDGLTAHTIVKRGGAALAVGDIPGALAVCLVEYNLANTRWELLNPANYVRPDATANLTAGYTTTSVNVGTKATGTFTPDPALGNMQHYVNGGAHTLAPPASVCTMVIECVNASAGALTTSGFTFVDGDVYSSTGTKKHIFVISKTNSVSRLTISYVQGT